MPNYEFKCSLDHTWVQHRLITERDDSGNCPECGREGARVFNPVPIIFKGPGFYVTDNRKQEGSNEEGS